MWCNTYRFPGMQKQCTELFPFDQESFYICAYREYFFLIREHISCHGNEFRVWFSQSVSCTLFYRAVKCGPPYAKHTLGCMKIFLTTLWS